MIVLKNYMVYIIIQLIFTLAGNIIRSRMAEKWYPFIKDKAVSKMLDSYKVEFSDKEYLRNLRKVQNNV